MSYWDVPERPLDPPEETLASYCDFCGGEIYDGNTVYDIDGQRIHEDCLEAFARGYFASCLTEVRL